MNNGSNGHKKTKPVVGRSQELDALKDLFELASGGHRQIVFLRGDAGIGKTALLDAFCEGLDPSTAVQVARGQCVQGVAHREEYYPVMEALAGLCASADGEQACAILARLAPSWLAALGRPVSSPATVRGPGELCAALEEIAVSRPLVLVFEDLHWADESTLALISALARRRATARILLLATVSPQHLAAAHPLRALKQDLGLRNHCAEIVLEPLGKAAVGELIAVTLGQPSPPADLDGFVHRHSEGNPMFALALVKHLIAQELLVQKNRDGERVWDLSEPVHQLEPAIPEELNQIIELDVQTLPAGDQRLLEAASLFTVAFPAWGVAAALDEDPVAIEEACDALARRLFFVRRAGYDELPGGPPSAFYVFAHGLYREVLYQRQAPARRSERHNRVALRLSALFAGREAQVAREMAAHYEAAGNWLPAVRALQSAARHANGRQSHRVADELLRDAHRIAANLQEQERATIEEELGSLSSTGGSSAAIRH